MDGLYTKTSFSRDCTLIDQSAKFLFFTLFFSHCYINFLQIFTFMVKNNNWPLYDWDKITTLTTFARPIDPQMVCFAHSKGVRVTYGGINLGLIHSCVIWKDNMGNNYINIRNNGLQWKWRLKNIPADLWKKNSITNWLHQHDQLDCFGQSFSQSVWRFSLLPYARHNPTSWSTNYDK